jgi:hypothetical protein
MVDGPVGPGFDVVSTMLSLILIGSVAYIVVSLAQRGAPPPAEPTDASNPVLRTMYTLALGVLVAAFVGRLPVIGGGLMLGGVLTLLYGVTLAIQAQSPLLRFLAVTVGLIVLLVALYLKFRSSQTAAP